ASRLASRLKGWVNGLTSSQQPDIARHEVRMSTKHAFINALARSEGGPAALRALRAAGLPDDWAINDRPLTSRTITKVLEHAQQFRASAVKANEQALRQHLSGLNSPDQRDLRASISAAVRSHPDFGHTRIDEQAMTNIVNDARQQVAEKQAQLCGSRYPGLTALARQHNQANPNPISQVALHAEKLLDDL